MIRAAAVQGVVLSGLVGLALVGAPDAVAAGIGAIVALAAPALRSRVGRLPWTVATGLVVAGLIAGLIAGARPAVALGLLLAYLQIHDRLTRGAEQSARTVVLAALMLLVAAGSTQAPLFAAAVAVFAAALPVALVPVSPRPGTAAALSLASVGLAGVLFAAAPRGLGGPRDTIELTGFSPEVELGALDELLDDPTPVLRAAIRPLPSGPVYWRGIALDTFDGSRWSSGSEPVRTTIQPPASYPADASVIEVEPGEPGVLFVSGWPLDIDAGGAPLWADGQGAWSVRVPVDRYRLVAQGPFEPTGRPTTPPETDDEALKRALQLPTDLDPRIAVLAAEVAGDGPPREQIQRLAAHLRTRYAYTRRPADAGAEGPLSGFLFERRAGHCEYFAASLAVLARIRGIPARVVNGFVGGEIEPETGWIAVRRYHAHAWVEVHDGGWILVDATPGPAATVAPTAPTQPWSARLAQLWDEDVLGYDRADQVMALLRAARTTERLLPRPDPTAWPWRGLALLLGFSLAAGWSGQLLARRLARTLLDPPRHLPSGPVARTWGTARRLVEDRGWRVPPALPPVAAATWVAHRAPGDASEALVELAWLYYAVHLGTAEAAAQAPAARRLLERIVKLPPSGTPP